MTSHPICPLSAHSTCWLQAQLFVSSNIGFSLSDYFTSLSLTFGKEVWETIVVRAAFGMLIDSMLGCHYGNVLCSDNVHNVPETGNIHKLFRLRSVSSLERMGWLYQRPGW